MSVFLDSIRQWFSHISVNTVLMMLMMLWMGIGAIDKIRGNRAGYGEKFEEGFHAIGSLALSMVGIAAAAPVLARIIGPVVTPLYTWLGADPSIFATTFLACDMGGYTLAAELAETPALGAFSGLILGTMMGPTLVFTIPVALGILHEEDFPYLGAGMMTGLSAVPLGCLAGGFAMQLTTDYSLPFSRLMINILPVLIISGLLVLGLWLFPSKMIAGFYILGKSITAASVFFCAVAVFEQMTGIMFPLLDRMAIPDAAGITPLDAGLLTCGRIGIVLIGAFPMVEWLTRTFQKSLRALGARFGINHHASAGMLASLAHVITTLHLVQDMDAKGKILALAFSVSAASSLGAHLGFTAGVDPAMVIPVLVGKITAGIGAVIISNLFAPRLLRKISSSCKK